MKRSGKGSDDAKPFNDFKSLKSEIPDFMVRNISKLKFEKPTPIQKHSIPLGLKGSCNSRNVKYASDHSFRYPRSPEAVARQVIGSDTLVLAVEGGAVCAETRTCYLDHLENL